MQYTHLILVEGKTDKKFVEDLLAHVADQHGSPLPQIQVIAINGGGQNADGSSNLGQRLDKARPSIEPYIAAEAPVLLLLDADREDVARRRSIAQQTIIEKNLPIVLYLIPDDTSNGAIESLMEGIISEDGKPVFACWKTYMQCLETAMTPERPNKENGYYAYAQVMGTEPDDNKPHTRNYRNPSIWNLDAPALEPLRAKLAEFLRQGNP